MSKSKTSFDDIDEKTGEFKRSVSSFRDEIKEGGKYPPVAGRYVLYISYACPWANRCLATLYLKGLEEAIRVVVVEPVWGDLDKREADEQLTNLQNLQSTSSRSWIFPFDNESAFNGSTIDYVNNCKTLRQLYELACNEYSGKYTVPVLWDTETNTIVNNESSEIIRMFDSEFNSIAKNNDFTLTPADLISQIDEWNSKIYDAVNNGVYRCGFAQSQSAYSLAFHQLFDTLDMLDEILGKRKYLCGEDRFTEADLRLFVTLIRFDCVYVCHFKTNKKRIADYKNLSRYQKEIYLMPNIKRTIKFDQIKAHYFGSHPTINPFGLIPIGPAIDPIYDQ